VDTGDRLLTPGEVAALFRVDPKTVTRWAAAGRIGSIRTPGGHRRFRESEVRALLEGELDELTDETGGRPNRSPGNTGGHASGSSGGVAPGSSHTNTGGHGGAAGPGTQGTTSGHTNSRGHVNPGAHGSPGLR
jgi:excisionase family DNA binding protein